jgi:hypothetical protein
MNDEFDRAAAKAAGYSDAEIDAYLQAQTQASKGTVIPKIAAESTAFRRSVSEPEPESALSVGERARGVARAAVGQGAAFGFGDEAEAAIRSALPGSGTYQQELDKIRAQMREFKQEYGKTALASELVGGLATGVAGAGRAIAKKGLQKATGAIVGSAVGQGAVSGAGAAEGDIGSRVKGAVLGGTIGAAVPYVGGKVVQKVTPASRAIAEASGRVYSDAQRAVANALERVGATRASRMVQPTDAIRVQREAAQMLPGSTTGPTLSGLAEADIASAAARRRATVAEAKQIAETGKERGGKLTTEAQRRTAAGAEQVEQLTQEAGDIRRAVPEAVRQAEEQAEAIAESNAASILGDMRVRRGNAREAQQTIRGRQLRIGDENYAAVRQMGPPPEVDPAIYKELLSDPVLRNAYQGGGKAALREVRNAVPARPSAQGLPIVGIDDQDVPEISLELFDQIRRRVTEPAFKVGPNVTGLSRSQKNAALEQINRLEERFLAGYGSDVAAETLRKARGEYRAEFKLLEALQDGLNFGKAKPGKAAGLLAPSRSELDAVVERVGAMSARERNVFQLGARESFDRFIRSQRPGAVGVLNKLSSEADLEKLRLAYGDDLVGRMAQFDARNVGAGAKAVGRAVRSSEQAKADALKAQAEQLAQSITAPGASVPRLKELATRAKGQGEIRGRQAMEAAKATYQTQAGRARALATAGEGALGTSTQQQDFLQRILPNVAPSQQQSLRDALGSNIQRRLQDMARAGKSSTEMLEEIRMLRQNDVVKRLFGNEFDQYASSVLMPSIVSRAPGQVRPAITGYLSRAIAPKED